MNNDNWTYKKKHKNDDECKNCGEHFIQFVDLVFHADWSEGIEKSLHPWDKSQLIMVYDPFYVLLDSDY